MPRMMYDFVAGATGREVGARRNRSAFDAIHLQPRVLVDVEGRSLHKTILGAQKNLPFGIAPMGMCNLAWPGADQMLASVAMQNNIPLGVSSAASTALEDMREQAGEQGWFQLYAGATAAPALQLARRAAEAGYTHLILTVDVPQGSRRVRDLRNGFRLPFRLGPRQFWDCATHPRWSIETLLAGIPRPMNFDASTDGGFARSGSRGAANWDFLDKLRQQWHGQLLVKGVLSVADALRIRQLGADALYVSNHGGRQLDSAPPAIAMLPLIRAAVGAGYPLLFDSGIRNGEDVVKALALGADFVMLGRPVLFAVGADGERGLATLIDIIAEEISLTMAQIGLRRIDDITRAVVVPPGQTSDPQHSPETVTDAHKKKN